MAQAKEQGVPVGAIIDELVAAFKEFAEKE
jgi:hypothetical protein